MARNKTKSVITKNNFDAGETAGDTFEGQRLLSLIRQSNELTAIHNAISSRCQRITDSSPIGSQASYDRGFDTESTIRPVAAIGAGVMNPAIPSPKQRQSVSDVASMLYGLPQPVCRYIEQNAGQPGIQTQEAHRSVHNSSKQTRQQHNARLTKRHNCSV